MRVTVLYFAAARERAGMGSEALELPDSATAGQALALACERHPGLQPIASKLRIAVDQDFAQPDRKLREGCEIALIPPVSGGSGAPHRIGPEPVSAEAPLRAVTGTDAGAVVGFTGTVRSSNHGKSVVRWCPVDHRLGDRPPRHRPRPPRGTLGHHRRLHSPPCRRLRSLPPRHRGTEEGRSHLEARVRPRRKLVGRSG